MSRASAPSLFFIPALLLSFVLSPRAHAFNSYLEAGTSIGTLSNGDSFFHQTGASSSGFGFVGSFSFYTMITKPKNIAHFELGLQNRLSTFSTSSATSLSMASPSLSIRLDFGRFYVGTGYAPLTFASTQGLTSLHTNSGASSYFLEGGAIWRVVPEFQVAATYAIEKGLPQGGGSSSTAMEYGLRFRFPLDPKETGGAGRVDFDGYRYPFGIMH